MFGPRALALLAIGFLAGPAVAQSVCECNEHVTGTRCNFCETGWMSDPDKTPPVPGEALVCNFPCLASVDCNGHGTCNYKDVCTCNFPYASNRTGCNKCAEGRGDYPNCTPLCNATQVCDAASLGNTCAAEPATCGPTSCDTDAGETCCAWRASEAFWHTRANGFREWLPKGEKSYYCAPKGMTCCGKDSDQACNARELEICADDLRGICQETSAQEGRLENEDSLCLPLYENGTTRPVNTHGNSASGYATCLDYETCCDGVCCSGEQTCIEEGSGRFGFVNGDGAPLDYTPMTCSSLPLTPQASSRVIVLPAMLALTFLGCGFLMFQTVGIGEEKLITVPIWLAQVLLFFLLFSQIWARVLMVSLMLHTMLVLTLPSSGKNRLRWSLFVAFVAYELAQGGSSGLPGIPFVTGTGSILLDTQFGAGTDPYTVIRNSMQSRCASFFGYFQVDSNSLDWDESINGDNYFGFCSYGMISFVTFASEATVALLLVTVLAIGYKLMQESQAGK
jgi:hypothetical protein